MTIFDSIITNSIPHLPKWVAKPFSKPYVAGETVEEALSEIRHLNSKGFSATIDILGEHTEEILKELGFTNEEIKEFKEKRIRRANI